MIKFLIGAALAAFVSAPALAEPPPLEAYGKLPRIEAVSLAPDGSRIAFIVTNGEDRNLLILDAADGKAIANFPAGPHKVRWLQWAGAERLLVTRTTTTNGYMGYGGKDETPDIIDVDIAKRSVHRLLEHYDDLHVGIFTTRAIMRPVKGRMIAYFNGAEVTNGWRHAMIKYDFDGNPIEIAQQGMPRGVEWMLDPDGAPLAEAEFETAIKRWDLRLNNAGKWTEVKSLSEDIQYPTILGLGRTPKSVLISVIEDGVVKLKEFTAGNPDWVDLESKDDATGPIFDPRTNLTVGTETLSGDHLLYHFFEPADQRIWDALVKAYPGAQVSLQGFSADRQKWLIFVDSADEGPAWALVDLTLRKGRWLGGPYDSLINALASRRAVSFPAGDGLQLSGYLTLPMGRDAKALPLIVFPHGGPASRDVPGFDWWAQAMASRGYAVLQVNYRGSAGYGWKFLSAGFGQYGRKMQTDLSDGVRYLQAQGVIDPKRVCIVGASYGGYAALAGATLDPDVYRCAVSVAGLSDLSRMLTWAKYEQGELTQRYWKRFLGVEGGSDPKLSEISPIRHVDRVKAPILLIHGKDDTVVDYAQSQIMYDTLKKAGKSVEFVTLNHEDHWLSTGATRLEMLQATMAFLQKNNPP